MLMLLSWQSGMAATVRPVSITLGHSVAALNGPWKFRAGDDANWANTNVDDASWETVDLTPLPGAHDSDVGLSGYVAGWQARGHGGYIGYGWYRLTLTVNAPAGTELALSGPPDVDSAYQVFLDGHLLGGIGDFSGRTPVAYSIQPHVFNLPASVASGHPVVLAIRVFMGPWDIGADDAGGIHIAPAIGERSSVEAQYRLQWLETVKGYIVEVVEAFLFVLLALMSLGVRLFDRPNAAYRWFALALLLVAAYRANQAIFYWWQFESIHTFEFVSYVMLVPLCLGAWVLAWRAWFEVDKPRWLSQCIPMMTLIYMCAQFFSCSWFYGVLPSWTATSVGWLVTAVRMMLLLALTFIVVCGVRKIGRKDWYALAAAVFISIGLFAQELSAIHVPGIWFPFGTGVSRTQYAYVAFDIAFAIFLAQRLRRFAHECADANAKPVVL
ncbi:glycoside hydrolase [Dyella dinghuensis]|uniref:Glycoside hydrolase n=1 Tax=Dyella dinghuensis TaxID=1920169 RepID=A0A3S0RF82_9GAMM|nr:glycoside hydrolase [Dyella dinghuensis]RUL65879.1 glycoside hydrolase [Dyella dinghuensis]